MADAEADAKEVFRRSTMNRIASADELDHYIKINNPSMWAVVIAALLLMVGIIVWAVVAIVPITVNTTGVTFKSDEMEKTCVMCWVDKPTAEKIQDSGAQASIDGVEAESIRVDSTPMSSSEIARYLSSDFYIAALHLDDWNYMVTIEPGEEPNVSKFTIDTFIGESSLVPVSITVSEKRPINIVLGKK